MKIRVLEVLASLRRAGAERMVVSLVRGLDPDRFETEVVSLFDAFPHGFEDELDRGRIHTVHLGKRRGLDLRMYPRLTRVFRSFRPAIVHTHSYVLRYAFPAAVAARVRRVVHTVHNVADKETDWLGRMMNGFSYRRGAIPVAVAYEVARSFRKVYGFDPAATIPNGIDTESYYLPRAGREWRHAHGFSDEDRLIISVARLDPQKNPRALVAAFAQAFAGNPRWKLLLVGDGSLREAVQQDVRNLDIADRVHLLGVRSDVAEALSASDAFALASHWEGNPISVMEAMAAGLPPVVTSVGGVPELVNHDVTGLLVPPDDVAAFAAALASLSDDDRRRKLGEAARQRSADFDVSAMVAAYSSLFERIAGGRL
ncbi:MAG: glycosyltransferase [Bryobacteraceae bacterium]